VAISGGGESQFASAFAVASASTDGQEALAEASAQAFCAGGETGVAFARAWSISISRDPLGCLTISKARARAIAVCGNDPFGGGGAFASASAEASTRVIGRCRPFGFFRGGGGGITIGGSTSGSIGG